MTTGPLSSPEPARILIVDDERFIRDILGDFLTLEGYEVRSAADGEEAVALLSRSHFDLILSDLKMPRMGGLALLRQTAQLQPDALTVIMTGFGTVETAIDAMKQGAYDYILKPFKVEEIMHVVQRGLEKHRLAAENLRLREALSLYKVNEAITASLNLDQVVQTVLGSALSEVRADHASLWLADGAGGWFERAQQSAVQTQLENNHTELTQETVTNTRLADAQTRNSQASPGQLSPSAILERLRSGAPLLLTEREALPLYQKPPDLPLVSFLAVPLRMQDRMLGFLCVSSWTEGKRFSEGQRKLLSIVLGRAAAAIENARLYEDLQATFQQTIQSLANTIDKMDHYTAGHSERVAQYAMRLARWMGLDESEVEIVRQSALMHDIGKIGCVLNLNKPGQLTAQEYESFKQHATYGKEILDPIAFLEPVIPGVHSHHERWDGRGYPQGLAGKNIPLIARIISVADTYDAMTSNRAYRAALPHEVAVGEIERCSHTQFDPDIAALFTEKIDLYREELLASGEKIPD